MSEATAPCLSPSPIRPSLPPPPVRVLLVEDDPECAQLVIHGLNGSEHARFEVTHAQDLGEGLRRSEERSYDAIVLDLALGWSLPTTTIAAFCVRSPDVPLLVFTAIDDDQVARFALGAGAFDYLVKGRQNTRTLAGAITLALEQWRALRDPSAGKGAAPGSTPPRGAPASEEAQRG